MNLNDILTIIDYNDWANARILNAVARLTPDQFNRPGNLPFGGVRGTLVHAFSAESAWRKRAQEGLSPSALSLEAYPDLPTLRAAWDEEQGRMRAWLAGLNDADLQRQFSYNNLKGEPQQTILWQGLAHMVNHGTQHRAEIAVLLTDFGQSPGDVDMIVYLREKARS